MIVIRNLNKSFPGNPAAALHDISLEIGAGLFFTLFGPSGCGKSTLLRCIAGLETPESGVIEIAGVTVFSSSPRAFVPPNRRRIGMVFQSYAIWPHMTVLENVSFPLEAQGKSDATSHARAALDLVGLAALESRYASRLSGGQQQRVAFARAIVGDPAVLLLDEPLSNLDAALRDQMRAELQALHRRLGVTTIYVTHDQTEALSMSDRIAVMKEGRFVEMGSPSDLYYSPRSPFTARLVGGANLIAGMARRGENGVTVVDTAFGTLLSSDPGLGPVDVFIRPERVRLRRGDEASPAGGGLVPLRVREQRFGGESTELDLVRASDGEGGVLRSRAASGLAAVDDIVQVIIAPADVRIFPQQAGQAG
jgi:iron(III) transport system ATP-binding protein